MDISSYQEQFNSTFSDDSIDGYLEDPSLSVSDMIEKYEVPLVNGERKKEKKTLNCAVCGGRAFGYNFDQISCESCKAFFRRNALRDINELRCRFDGNCGITVENRRHCSSCRIKKCFAVGMRKEWIRSEEEKHMKRLRLEKSRRRKHIQQTIKVPVVIESGYLSKSLILSLTDRVRLNNITHCFDQFSGEPSMSKKGISPKYLTLRADEFFNRKKPIMINLISYLKHLPELQTLDIDDQVALIKRNIRLLIPLNYAILKTPTNTKFGITRMKTIGCVNNINLHDLFRTLSDSYVEIVKYDPILMKLLIIVLFFTTNPLTTKAVIDPVVYIKPHNIKQMQSSYTELLWLYMLEKWGEQDAVHLFTKMITKYLCVQITIDQIDAIIEENSDIQNIDSLMKTFLQLT